jgi:hypothetical protein
MWICTNLDETPADYNISVPGAFTLHIEGSYPD